MSGGRKRINHASKVEGAFLDDKKEEEKKAERGNKDKQRGTSFSLTPKGC
ncbi:hypothetical protein SESBI_04969 [Sesbania bispinosa]|nr:hypothetical protein SESBI_04969 [Sesbania bispinosa]